MPAKKTETKDTVTKKGTKPVETKAKKTAARTKTTKKAEPKAKETVKKAAKTKQTVKKTETLKDDKTSVEAVKDDKVKETKKTTAKKAPAKKTTTKKTTTKKTTAAKTTKKSTTKKTDTKQKMEQYNQFSLDTCIDMAKAMGIDMGYDQYAQLLMDQSDTKEIVKTILEQYPIKADAFSYEEDGYDLDLLEVLVAKVAQTVTIKASDYAAMGKEIEAHEAYVISEESLDNNDEYNADFDLVRRLLMIAQRKDIHTMSDLQTIVTADATKLIEKFMDVAYAVLKNWQYDDVKYYENFIYAVLSQFNDLYQAYENKAMMDVADLYIEHGDYGLGDANYAYILRENQIKDYIYYRYAKAYEHIDYEKSRAIANEALQFVDDRYTYYPNIRQLLEN
ncbi:neurofilament protein [Faecalicoccus pleomorphus]|uniref:neurofilament protein n=1 Tax=Faecalicoccus pleomorphus TaxID=1323 RepID=UPI00232ED74B|nr:neurofilament protein [Faecalicoccus pleomorphus]MDB7987131.1 neurofilament protein [Faecalicoccus pleomorphus]MDB7990987.1 neurofilament protein [Faecalicoccus pleomorphus]